MSTIAQRLNHIGGLLDHMSAPGESALEKIDTTTSLLEQLELVRAQLVDLARSQSESWAKVGAAMGVSKQAAYERYGQRPVRAVPEDGTGNEATLLDVIDEEAKASTTPDAEASIALDEKPRSVGPLLRGTCPTCQKTYQLSAGNLFPKHYVYVDGEKQPCAGSRTPASAPAL